MKRGLARGAWLVPGTRTQSRVAHSMTRRRSAGLAW
jgi:hypothetical protein